MIAELLAKARPSFPEELELDGRTVALDVLKDRRARKLHLRADPNLGVVRLTLPLRTPVREGLEFLHNNQSWLAKQVARWPAPVPFAPDVVIPFNDQQLRIDWQEARPRRAQFLEDSLCIGGPREGLAQRIERALRRAAQPLFDSSVQNLAARVERSVARVRLTDPKARWGSCSRDGVLNFSWRLVLAPNWVREAVIAHEVAHLVHMNHSARFWALAHELYEGDMDQARAWLSAQGANLHWIGRD